jgi:ribose transport system substrate-binding protein
MYTQNEKELYMNKERVLVVCVLVLFVLMAFHLSFAGSGDGDAGKEEIVFGNVQPGPDPWYQYSVKAFEYFAKENGVEVVYLNSEYNQDKDIANVEDLIAKKVDALSVFPMTADLGQQYVQKANEAGIPFISEAVTPSDGPGEYVTVVSYAYSMLGAQIAEYVHEEHPGAKLVYITGKPGTGIVEQYVEGLVGRLEELNSDVEIVSQQPTDWNRQQAMDITQNLLQAGTEIDVIFANNEDMAGGVIQVIKEAGKLGEIAVVATGGSPEGIQLIKAGELEATAAASAGLEGALCFKACWDTYHGVKIPKVINPPVMMATKDNIESALTWEVNDTLIDIVENYEY